MAAPVVGAALLAAAVVVGGRLIAAAGRSIGTAIRRARAPADTQEHTAAREPARGRPNAAERLRENAAERAALRRRLGELEPEPEGATAGRPRRTGVAHHPPWSPAPEPESTDEPEREVTSLSGPELEEAYELIQRRYLEDHPTRDSSEQPIAVIVAGQPGSGKGELGDRAFDRLTAAGHPPVRVDADQLRVYHRDYPRLVAEDRELDPLARGLKANAASLVAPETTEWTRMLLKGAIAKRADLVYETTGRSREGMSELTALLKDAGYCVEVQALATPRERSLQGVNVRYAEARAMPGEDPARYVSQSFHDSAYHALPDTVDQLYHERRVDSLAVLRDFDHSATFEAYFPSGRVKSAVPGETPGEALRAERERGRTAPERELFEETERYGAGLSRALKAQQQSAGAHTFGRGRPPLGVEPEAPARPARAAAREHEVCTVRELSR